jgi:hypothetical protein
MVTVKQEYERGETHLKTMGIIPVSAFFSKYLIILISMLMFIVIPMIFFLAISCLPHTGEQEVLKRFVSELYIL